MKNEIPDLFHPLIHEWFTDNFNEPSPPQMLGWPAIASGKHTLILAPTGSGKTLAAFLWSIDRLVRSAMSSDPKVFTANPHGVHTLYISPLKALNNDIERNLQVPLQGIYRKFESAGLDVPAIRAAVRSGDTPSNARQSMLRHPPHILITTPESFYLFLTSASGRGLFHNLQYIIVDEIHALSNSKRGAHLSLSLERLTPLCSQEPIRIGLSATQKPLERIAAFLGGRQFIKELQDDRPRPVEIIDCGQRKDMDVSIITPVSSFEGLPDHSVWQPVYEKLYQLILEHRTTLIFANMRAQTEKIARKLNELHREATADPEAQLILAHHGSISREARYEVEEKLKLGKIPAVVATASLELGIDIGGVDLVVLLEAPRQVSAAIQRVGRSGHMLHQKSKGRIIVLYPSDLDDALALVRCLLDGEIEENTIPENALDVLAQQIVAEVSVQEWPYENLFTLIRQSYCYRNLSSALFKNVIEMLSGRYETIQLSYLKPRIVWDKINNRLISRRGSRLLAAMNGGTIPDRGYYGVYLKDSNVRLGEVEEEFVFETKIGEAFFLGNSEWRIDQTTKDRIIVTPVNAIQPKPPFWKGGVLYREFSTSQKIGRFRRELQVRIEAGTADQWLQDRFPCDEASRANLIGLFKRQLKPGQQIADDRQIVVESCNDINGMPVIIIHASFGARVNGLWVIVLRAVLEKLKHIQIQYAFDDDGIFIRQIETDDHALPNEIFRIELNEVEPILLPAILESPAFALQFRHNATRALLLPRSQVNNRIPLWLQRLRAADLLQAVRNLPDFPIVLETYRELLNDVFDLSSLLLVLNRINSGEIIIRHVRTSFPSPMTSGVLFKFTALEMYDYDQTRRPAELPAVNNQFLNELIDREEIPAILSPEIIAEAEARWQNRAPGFQAKDREDLFAMIDKLGPLTFQELEERSIADVQTCLKDLNRAGRLKMLAENPEKWISTDFQNALYKLDPRGQLVLRLQRFLKTRGPVGIDEITGHIAQSPGVIEKLLLELKKERQVVYGRLIEDMPEYWWCNRNNFNELYRQTISRRRRIQKPADRKSFFRFLLEWHGLNGSGAVAENMLAMYSGLRFPIRFFEREILVNRIDSRSSTALGDALLDMEQTIAQGRINVFCGRQGEEGRYWVSFIPHGLGHIFTGGLIPNSAPFKPDTPSVQIMNFLKENGASRLDDIRLGTGMPLNELHHTLRELVVCGAISNDNYEVLIKMIERKPADDSTNLIAMPYAWPRQNIWRQPGVDIRQSRNQIKQKIQSRLNLREGRWFATSSFSVMGKPVATEVRAEHLARILLQRYGILIKEWYRYEEGLPPWYEIFQALKRLEWQGEIRRGYFIDGLSGLQFALPEALELLQGKLNNDEPEKFNLCSTMDIAIPFGKNIPWQLQNLSGEKINIVRSASNYMFFKGGVPVLYSEQYGQRLQQLIDLDSGSWRIILDRMKIWLRLPDHLRPRRRLEIAEINGAPAVEFSQVSAFIEAGFERADKQLVLWPSAV